MKKIITKFLIVAIIISFSNCRSQENKIEKYNCEIINTETLNSIKKTIEIKIPEQLPKSQLKEIATYLKEENSSYEKLFIFYYLPEMNVDAGAWATTHFNPTLNVRILGADKTEEKEMKSLDIPENAKLIGEWYNDRQYAERSIIIYKIANKYKMKEKYKDGSTSEKELQYSTENGMKKFVYDNDFGEYMIVKNNGDLALYDSQGLISVAEKIK